MLYFIYNFNFEQVKDTHVLTFLEKCLLTVQQKLDANDNSSDQYKLYESLLRRHKKFKQKTVTHNILDTPVQNKTIDKVLLFNLFIHIKLILRKGRKN